MKEELGHVLEQQTNISIPQDLGTVRHSIAGGMSSADNNHALQQKVDKLTSDFDLSLKKDLKKYFERDFTLFQYHWNITSNKLFE